MKTKIRLWVLFLTTLFCLQFSSDSLAKKRSGEEKEMIEHNHLWDKEFSGQVLKVELLSNSGILHVVAKVGKKKPSGVKKENWPKKRYLVDQGGEILWEDDYDTTALLADNPSIVMLKGTNDGISLMSINSAGGTNWKYSSHYGTPISTLADPSSATLYMVVLPYQWVIDTDKPANAKVIALSLGSGTPKWETNLAELEGILSDFDGGELEENNGILWWAGGGKAAAIQTANGALLWQKELDKKFQQPRAWVFGDGMAYAASQNQIWAFSKQSGPKWNQEFGKKQSFYSMVDVSGNVLVATGDNKNYYLQLLDKDSGKENWISKYKAKPNKFGLPQGIAVSGGKAVFAVEGKIIAISPSTGKEIYSHKIKKKTFNQWNRIIPKQNHFVLMGPEGINAYRYSDGEELWSHGDFVDPVAEIRRTREASLQMAFEMLYSSTAPEAKEAWDKHREGSIDYTNASITATGAQAAHNQKMAAQARESASSTSQSLTRLIESDLVLVNKRAGPDYEMFYGNPKGKWGITQLEDVSELDAVLINLNTGEIQKAGLPKTKSACVSQVLVDPVSGKVYQAIRQMALACKDENTLRAYRMK